MLDILGQKIFDFLNRWEDFLVVVMWVSEIFENSGNDF